MGKCMLCSFKITSSLSDFQQPFLHLSNPPPITADSARVLHILLTSLQQEIERAYQELGFTDNAEEVCSYLLQRQSPEREMSLLSPASPRADGRPSLDFANLQDNTEMGETSQDIGRFKPPSRFTLNGPLLHVFLSFRAGTEMATTSTLHEATIRLSKETYPIPPGARGRPCPQVAEPRHEPDVCKVFFAPCSLLDGKDWETSIMLGLAHSVVFVPILSWGENNTGSVGSMVHLSVSQRVDNVLIEYIIALALKTHAEGSIQARVRGGEGGGGGER